NGTIDVQLYREDDIAMLSVKDSGIGIPRDQQDKIFERFYVVDKSRNKKISSTGLGLSIVKHIVKAHEGTIELVSRPGKGSQFIVKLPLE
ncbi:MAG: ATP-binding protein, partial [Oscillospiraceae bacterium]|nr:ATP-binding protein [Oscillospiraceae bacterium]